MERKARTLFPSLKSGVSWGKRDRTRRTRTDTNYCAIFRLVIVSGDGGWTEKDKSEEEKESERQARDEAGCMRPCWTRHVEVWGGTSNVLHIFMFLTRTLATYANATLWKE